METIYRLLILLFVILAITFVRRKFNNFSVKNKFSYFEQKCTETLILIKLWIGANYAFYQQLAEGDVVESIPIVLSFIQEIANYPAFNILNDACNCEASEKDMITYLGNNDYEKSRKKRKLLGDYWYSKSDAKYTNNSEKSISIARQCMIIPKQQKAIAAWEKLLTYTSKFKNKDMKQVCKKNSKERLLFKLFYLSIILNGNFLCQVII